MKSIGVAIGAAGDELVHHGCGLKVVEEFGLLYNYFTLTRSLQIFQKIFVATTIFKLRFKLKRS